MADSIVVDLDGTICSHPADRDDTLGRYGNSTPNWPVIEGLRELKLRGFEIIIFTARRMVTFDGNVSMVEADVRDVTEEWLKMHDVPYDRLVFGKPWTSTYYVDDKAMTPEGFVKWIADST